MNDWWKIIQDWLFPPTCLLCGDRGQAEHDLCLPCRERLPARGAGCPRCASALPFPVAEPCGRCLRRPPPFDAACAAFDYREPIRFLVRELKFERRLAASRLLGALLADAMALRTPCPQILIPVPLSAARYRSRGFNQSALIAAEAAARLAIPVNLQCVRRVRDTPSQTGLAASARRRNVRGAFEVVQPVLAGTRIAIVDDVMTTGATVEALAESLKRAGAGWIDVWTCARADRDAGDR